MTTINQELYEALIAAGAPDDVAKRAAASVLSWDQRTDLATQRDLKELEYRLTIKLGGLIAAGIAIIAALVKL